tara:strand:+ start:501 stop:2228 length:1728 start_codon:yes stop_codon:yes gene_type:complete
MHVVVSIHTGHDSSAVLLINGKIELALQEERFSRVKNHTGFPFKSLIILKCYLFENNINSFDLAIANQKITKEIPLPLLIARLFKYKYHKIINYLLILIGSIYKYSIGIFFSGEFIWRKLLIYKVNKFIGLKINKVSFHDHHTCHAASAAFSSGFKNCLVVTQDGTGDKLSGSLWIFNEGILINKYKQSELNSLGQIYAEVTRYLGFKPNRHEGKITGLAANGESLNTIKEFSSLISVNHYGCIERKRLTSKLSSLNYQSCSKSLSNYFEKNLKFKSRIDIAAGVQLLTEKIIKDHLSYFASDQIYDIALAGGLFANVKVNQEIRNQKYCSRLYIQPAMGDSGLALGAAQLASYECGNYPKKQESALLGTDYDNKEIIEYIKKENFDYVLLNEKVFPEISNDLYKGKIVGIFQGRMEWGPRALGSRSILANASEKSVNNKLNNRLKRSDFMPFAPIVLDIDMPLLFTDWEDSQPSATYMTSTYNINKEFTDKVQAIVHVDGTARPQCVKYKDYPFIYNILKEYKVINQLGIVINTSFNLHEEPIVESPYHALKALRIGAVDELYMNNIKVLNKKK